MADRPWSVRLESGETTVVEPGRSIGLIPGMAVNFGAATARLEHAV